MSMVEAANRHAIKRTHFLSRHMPCYTFDMPPCSCSHRERGGGGWQHPVAERCLACGPGLSGGLAGGLGWGLPDCGVTDG